MKRVVAALVLVCVVSLLLAGESAPAQRPFRVGYIVGVGATPDPNDLFGLPYSAFIRAVKKFGVEGRVLDVAPNQDSGPALQVLARQGYDLVILGIPDNPATVASVALKFPKTKFLVTDLLWESLPGRPRNVEGTDFRAGEAGYLAGYLAALMEKRTSGRHVVSSVGGFPLRGVDRYLVGYRAGARKADPNVVALNAYSHDFSNPALCRAIALGQIARGSGVVFNVAGACGLGALQAAKEMGVWGVGVDVDQSFLGKYILTSAVLRLDRPVLAAIRQLVQGRFTTGSSGVFDLRNGGVGLGRISPEVPVSILRKLARVRREIISGRIRVPRAS